MLELLMVYMVYVGPFKASIELVKVALLDDLSIRVDYILRGTDQADYSDRTSSVVAMAYNVFSRQKYIGWVSDSYCTEIVTGQPDFYEEYSDIRAGGKLRLAERHINMIESIQLELLEQV